MLKAYSDAMDAWARDPQDFHGLVYPLAAAEWTVLAATQSTFVPSRP